MNRHHKGFAILGLTLLAPLVALSHHSPNLHYDRADVVVIAGVVTGVDWANPHSIINIAGSEEGQSEAEWVIETGPAVQLTRRGVTQDAISVGDQVRAAGFRGKRNTNAIFLTNILLADEREWVPWRTAEPIWTNNLVGADPTDTLRVASNDSRTILKVWSRDQTVRTRDDLPRSLWKEDYPLTEVAMQARSNWDHLADNPYLNCQNGMPAIMDTGHPMQFLQQDGNVVLHIEEQDVRRVIVMGDEQNVTGEMAGPYGRSSGQWEGNSLVVRTTGIDWPWFDQAGIPQSEALEIIERFTPSEDGMMLNYRATVTDPAIFTEPVVLERYWVYEPGVEIQDYECRWDESNL